MGTESGQRKKVLEIRHHRHGDENQLNELFQSIFHIERPLAGWYWKFRDNPFLQEPLISLAAAEGDRIVGMYPLLVMEFKVKDQLVLAVQLVEISIHPDYRGRWIIRDLKSFLQPRTIRSGVRFGFGFPTRGHAKVGLRYMGYRLLGSLPILGIRLDKEPSVPLRLLRRALERGREPITRWYWKLRLSRWKKAGSRQEDIEIEELDDFDDRFDRLWENISSDYSVLTHRSSRYLHWRYRENPMADFTLLSAIQDGEIRGYLVSTTLMEGGKKNGVIFDFFCGREDPAGRILLGEGLLRLLGDRVKSIRCGALPHTPLYRDLVELGFAELPMSPLINFEALDDLLDPSVMGNLEGWYLGLGDTDLLGW